MSTFVADLEAPGVDEDARAEDEMAALDDAEEAEESEGPEQSAPTAAGAEAPATVGRRAKGVPSRPGAELSLYVSGDAQSLKPCGYAEPGAFRVSKILFLCFLRGLWVPPTEADQEAWAADQAAAAAAEKEDKKPLLSILRGDKFRQAHGDWIAMENFSVKYHGGTAFSKWVVWCEETAMKIASSTGSARQDLVEAARRQENEPLPLAVLQSLKQSCVREAGQMEDYAGVHIPGQGVGYPTVYQYMCACALFHGRLGLMHRNPARLRAVTDSLREMRENHAIEHTTVLDVLEDLPFIRRAIFQSPSLCDGEKLMWWSLVTSSIDHANRPSEVSRFCPTLDMVALPGSARPVPHGFDSMGFPKWLEIKRDRWKGKKKRDPAITQNLHANVAGSADFCSVVAMLLLLRYYDLHGVKKGPLFRKFAVDPKTGKKLPAAAEFEKPGKGSTTWYEDREPVYDRDGHQKHSEDGVPVYKWKTCASLSEAEVREQLHVFFQEAAEQADAEGNEMAAIRLAAATPHSFRATCVGWAARSGSSNAFNEARLAGRWKFSSKVFLVYWRLGMQISREFVGSGDQDQIHDFKPWPAGGTTNSLSQDTSSFSGADPNADAGDVNVRKRKARSEDKRACKRRDCIKKGKKSVEAELRKNTDARARRVMETGAEEEDDAEE